MAKDDKELKTLVLNPKDKPQNSVVLTKTDENTTETKTTKTSETVLTENMQFTIKIF